MFWNNVWTVYNDKHTVGEGRRESVVEIASAYNNEGWESMHSIIPRNDVALWLILGVWLSQHMSCDVFSKLRNEMHCGFGFYHIESNWSFP